MTNEELKKKIAGILKEAMKPIEYGGDIEHAPEVHYPTEDEIAYALIEEGIGDVEEEKHWSEVVLLALINSLSLLSKIQREVSVYIQSKIPSLEEIIDQAEEELAEGAENDGTQTD